MKKQIALLIALVVAATSVLTAGPVELEPKTMVPPTITDDDHWHFNIGMPGWFAFISGDIGLHGATSNVGVDFGQIITHAAGIASISAEARKGRFGVYGDLLYMSLSAGFYNDGLVKKANLTVDSYIADGEVYSDLRALSVPIVDADGETRAAVSVNGNPNEPVWDDLEKLVRTVEEAARDISRRARILAQSPG